MNDLIESDTSPVYFLGFNNEEVAQACLVQLSFQLPQLPGLSFPFQEMSSRSMYSILEATKSFLQIAASDGSSLGTLMIRLDITWQRFVQMQIWNFMKVSRYLGKFSVTIWIQKKFTGLSRHWRALLSEVCWPRAPTRHRTSLKRHGKTTDFELLLSHGQEVRWSAIATEDQNVVIQRDKNFHW